MTIRFLKSVVIVLFLVALSGCAMPQPAQITAPPEKPNLVFVLTDDQEAELLEEMPQTNELLVSRGTTFSRATISLPGCCPSRATMLRGQYAHNHGIWGNQYPVGGARLFAEKDLDASTVATWLDDAGYRTGLVGKYLNDYETLRIPPGWDSWVGQLGQPKDGDFNAHGRRVIYENEHPDAVIAQRAVNFVEDAAPRDEPFMLWAGFNAPHAPGYHHPKYNDDFGRAQFPRTPNFNEADVSDKPAYVRSQPRLTGGEVDGLTALHRDRLRALQTVDAAVGTLVRELEAAGELDNTYFVFWADNGLHAFGQHRLPAQKGTPYTEDVETPMVVRGPGVPEGATRGELVLNTDLAPTFADLAGAQTPDFVDGRSFAPLLDGGEDPWRDAVLLERQQDPFEAIRTANRSYVEYPDGERELYDLDADPYQLESLHDDPARVEEMAALSTRLEALRNCSGDTCRAAESP